MESQKGRKALKELDRDERRVRHEMFNRYITPNLNLVYKCVLQYSIDKSFVEDNFVEALVNFYAYIDTYNPSRPLATWIHVVSKRLVYNLELKRARTQTCVDDIYAEDPENVACSYDNSVDIDLDNWRELFDDDILWALESLKPIYLEALLLQAAGYRLSEIVEISHVNGNLPSRSIDTIKSRLFLAKAQVRSLLKRDGTRKDSKEI